MSEIPAELRYTAEHEWARLVGPGTIRVGVTDYAQNSLGDVVFVTVFEVGGSVEPGSSFGEVESTKSVSDLYAPVSGTVARRNEALDQTPELVNSDPYGEGWIAELTVADDSVLDSLLDADGYRASVGE